jgi:cation diffusion facilitator family transporter
MTQFLIRLFIKDSDNIYQPQVRQRYGVVTGLIGIVCNIFLFGIKLLAGLITSSISIMADAFNNLSDAGSSVITLVGFKIAGMPADDEHPFGHGRVEYVSGLIISLIIMMVGLELLRSSFDKILHPEAVSFSWLSFVILFVSIAVKLWMCFFYRGVGKKIDSDAMKATAMDSLSDVVATSAVVIGVIVNVLARVNIDGYVGILVALFILYTGFNTARDTMNDLLGQAPDPGFVAAVEQRVLSYEIVVGVHDLIVHNYGPGRCIISLHAEVPRTMDILKIHDEIDNIERELKKEFQCEAVIHMDPIAIDDRKANQVYDRVKQIVREIDSCLTIHDFRMVEGPSHTNLIFDVVAPHKFHLSDREIVSQVEQRVQEWNPSYYTVITVDKAYVS